jgi:NADH-quinone oxidoreductase subunit G
VQDQLNLLSPSNECYIPDNLHSESGLMVISEVPMYQTDAVLRRSSALQQTTENQQAKIARMNRLDADKFDVSEAESIEITQDSNSIIMPLVIDDAIAQGCIYLAAGIVETSELGTSFSNVTVQAIQTGST